MWLSSTAFKISPLLRAYKPTTIQENPVQGSAKGSNLLHLDSFRTQRQGKIEISEALQLAMDHMNYGVTLIRPNEKNALLEHLPPEKAFEHLQNAKTVVFGDSHGNGLGFIENMLMFGMLKVKNQEQYKAFLDIYEELEANNRPSYKMFIETRDKEDYTYTEKMKQLDQAWLKKGGETLQAGRLLKLIKLLPDAIEVDKKAVQNKKAICVGDELGDRGPSDWILLEVLAMIRAHKNAKDDTLVFNLSNHATGYFYSGPKSVSKTLATLAQERQNFLTHPIASKKGIKSLYNTRSMGETYSGFNALPDGDKKTEAFNRYQDLLKKQYMNHKLIHQEGHVVTTHAFVSKETEQKWRDFLHSLDPQTFSDKDTSLHLQSGEAYQKTIAKINALTHDYLIYQMANQKQKEGTVSNLTEQTLDALGNLIYHTVDEREKPKQPHWLHGGFQNLEEAGFVPPADLCNGKTPHRIYGHTGKKDEPANNHLDLVNSDEAPFLKKLWVSCVNHTVRKYEEWQNLYVRKKGKDGKPHKENPIVIIE
ncbi:MAG: hypothetical protein ACK5T0_01410 [Vampirovibrionales bacterium]